MKPADRWIAGNVSELSISAIKDMAMRSAEVEGAVSLTWGLPSFRTPEHIRQAVAEALETDPNIGKYSLPDGLPILRAAIVANHLASTGISVSAEENVVVTAGNTEGLSALFRTIIDPGDEIILTDPCFATHIQQIRFSHGVPVFWPMDESRGWQPDIEMLPTLIGARTKAILLVTPSNPTGTIINERHLRHIGEIALQHNLLVILDDPYSSFLYENRKEYFNLASVPDLFGHTVYLFTFSKAHAMSGFRLGYMIVPEGLKRQVLKVHDATIICAPRISQIAGYAALNSSVPHQKEFETELGERRKLICERLDRLSEVFEYVRPQGAYYVFPRLVDTSLNSHDSSIRLLEEVGVAVTPGSAFGPSGEGHIRMAFCVSKETINTAFDRMDQYFGTVG